MAVYKAGKSLLVGLSLLGVVAGLLRLSSRLPLRDADDTSPPPAPDPGTALASAAARLAADHPGLSGVHLLADGQDAFAARMLLAARAERTLDLQYYIWHGDLTGTLMLEAVHRAADRGVAVRLLLDDNGISGLDTVLAALDRHPKVEVRLFNPFRIRFPKAVGFLADFGRLNRRMHNKSFTVDGAATIVGGRNIGDEYFGGRETGLFADLDVLAIGAVVDDVQADFERYWTCASAYPARQILPRVGARVVRKLARRASLVERDPTARHFVHRIATLPIVQELMDGRLDLTWCPVRLVSDDPAKAQGRAGADGMLAGQLEKAIGVPERELGIVAGYFVPGKEGTQQLCQLADRGVAVSVLTNAYAATDVALVHAGYAPARHALLKAGVVLFELCGDAAAPRSKRQRRKGTKLGIGSRLRGTGTGSTAALRSHASTLHAKTFTVDRERLFVGSFNFDPRSVDLNTELGFVIDSPDLAAQVADGFVEMIPAHAYRLALGADDALTWTEQVGDQKVVHDREPGMHLTDHLVVGLGHMLPVQWLL